MTLKIQSADKPKHHWSRRQWINGSMLLIAAAYWQLIAVPLAHFAILAAPTNVSAPAYMGNGHTWLETFGEGWGLIGSELFGAVLTAVSIAGMLIICVVVGAISEGIYHSLMHKRAQSVK